MQSWMKERSLDSLTSEDRKKFTGYLAEQYYKTVSAAIRAADPNHLYIGSRLHSNAKNNRYIFQAANKYVDIYSINYYGDWEPQTDYLTHWSQWTDKPFFITEFYTKAESTGMSNKSGAGWIVRTQQDRGIHYQNFCLKLLQYKNCVGWHWFRYQDNDPNDAKSDDSNKDSNKGIVDIRYRYYNELTSMMAALNNHIHGLVALIDKSIK